MIYETRDMNVAAYLLAKGMVINTIEYEGRIAFFVFNDAEQCKQLETQYKFGDGAVDAKKLINAQNELRDILHGRKNA